MRTGCPVERKRAARFDPMNPAPPQIRTGSLIHQPPRRKFIARLRHAVIRDLILQPGGQILETSSSPIAGSYPSTSRARVMSAKQCRISP